LLVSDSAFAVVAERFPGAARRVIRLRGKNAEIGVYSLPVA
jgi:hypothetical protein